jgi:hypothetical protein
MASRARTYAQNSKPPYLLTSLGRLLTSFGGDAVDRAVEFLELGC